MDKQNPRYLGLLVLKVKPSISFLQLSVYSSFLHCSVFYTNWKEFLSLHSAIKNQQRMTNFTIQDKKSQRGFKTISRDLLICFFIPHLTQQTQFLCLRSHNVCSISRQGGITSRGVGYKQIYSVWHYRLWVFQERDTKLARFLAKNQL